MPTSSPSWCSTASPARTSPPSGDADTDAKKQVLFEQVRQGTVRILLGSTQKMGTGTNVQKRLVALHHWIAPWKRSEVEQRDGRILRCPFTHNMARLPGYASNATLPGYASSRVDCATDERAHGGLLLPPQLPPEVSQRRDVFGITGDIAWSGKLRGHTVNGGEDALRMEREGDRADFLQTGLVALLEARLLIRVVSRGNLAAERGEMMPKAVGTAPQVAPPPCPGSVAASLPRSAPMCAADATNRWWRSRSARATSWRQRSGK